MEKISVIIPVYNTEKYLDKSFESILNQTYTNLEIIVINDGSNETTSNKLKQFAKEDQRIRLFELPEREGVGHARNYALRSEEHTSELQSRGHLVCRLLLENNKKSRFLNSTSTKSNNQI